MGNAPTKLAYSATVLSNVSLFQSLPRDVLLSVSEGFTKWTYVAGSGVCDATSTTCSVVVRCGARWWPRIQRPAPPFSAPVHVPLCFVRCGWSYAVAVE